MCESRGSFLLLVRLAGYTGIHYAHGNNVEYLDDRFQFGGEDSAYCWNDIRVLSMCRWSMDLAYQQDWDPQLMRTSLRLTSHRQLY